MTRFYSVVQAGFGTSAPADPNPTVSPAGTLNLGGWTTLSTVAGAGVRDISGARTSQNQSSGEAEPGMSTLVLDDIKGWLDPENPSGPYYGYLVPGVPIRKLTFDGTTYTPAWRGFVSKWPSSQGSKGIQDATIECYDPIGWLGGTPPRYPSELYRAIMASSPSSYWPHDDPQGSTTARDVVSGFDAAVNGTAALGGSALTPDGYGGSAGFANLPGDYLEASPLALPRPPFTIFMVVRISTVWAGSYFPGLLATGPATGPGAPFGPPYYLSPVAMNSQWAEAWDGNTAHDPATQTWVPGGTILNPGLHILAMTYDATTVASFHNNAKRSNSLFPQQPSAYSFLRWGAALEAVGGDTGSGCDISHLAVWPRVVSDADIIGFGTAAIAGRTGETAHDRFHYLLDQVDWPAGQRSIGATKTVVGPVRMDDGNILDPLKRVTAFEDGVMGALADGTIFLIGRDGDPAPSFAIGGAAAPVEDPAWSTDELTAVSSATVSDPPVTVTSGDTISNGRQVRIEQLAVSTDDAWLVAQRAVQLGQQPRPGVDQVTLDPVLVPAALTMDVGDVGTFARRPIWSPTDIAYPMQVTSVQDIDGAAQRLLRRFTMLAPRRHQWHLRAPNHNPTGATAGNTAAMSPANLTVEALFRVDDWGSLDAGMLVAHADYPQTRGFQFFRFPTLTTPSATSLALVWCDNAGTQHAAGSNPIFRAGTRYIWGKATLDPSTGTVTFWVSIGNRSQYAQWGQTVVGATTLRSYTGALEVGQDAAGNFPLIGDVLVAKVATLAGVPIASMDPTADNQPGVSTWAASTGETWALQGSGLLVAA